MIESARKCREGMLLTPPANLLSFLPFKLDNEKVWAEIGEEFK
jgi:hypothetical protein